MSGFFLLLAACPALGFFGPVCALAAALGWVKFARDSRGRGWEWAVVMLCGLCWLAGAGFYFYMPLAGMTNPPMEWGYPRTVDGFIHAFTRGQYEKMAPSDVVGHPAVFMMQLVNLGQGIVDEFNWVYCFLALVPFLFFFKLHKRERAWLIGITAIYFCLGVVLLYLLNPPPDRGAQELNRVFFTASHSLVSLLVGYGLTLIAAFMATHYQRFRLWGLCGAGVAVLLALLSFVTLTQNTFFGEDSNVAPSAFLSLVLQTFTHNDQYGLPVFAGLILVAMTLAFLAALFLHRTRAPLAITLALFALMPLHSILTHWSDNEQRNHWFGYWFGHDMFSPPFHGADGKPLYPEMTRNAVLFGGTDPGRFCPTYMIFCDSFIPHPCQPAEDRTFDRRDVYIITQNALADATYLCYIRAQYNRSAQVDPPFFQELFRSPAERQQNSSTNLLARALRPLDRVFLELGDRIEKHRRTFTSWLTEKDFTNLPELAVRLRPGPRQDRLSKYLYENLSAQTQHLLAAADAADGLRSALAKDFNRLLERELRDPRAGPLYGAERFKQVPLSEYLVDFIKQNPRGYTRIRLNRLLLEAAYPNAIAPSPGGVYPDREISTPTPAESAQCFQEYMDDAARRLQLHQLDPGEGVSMVGNRLQISGQISVMAINSLFTKVIFDHNPKNDFFIEESLPLKWMYPYLAPFGIIMKINRQPLPELSEEMVRRDHEFWTQYSRPFIGDWLTYDTPIKDIATWAEKVYLRRDFTGFQGDRKFIRDDQAQKSFSKLRGSIAGLYAWRVTDPANQNPAVRQRMMKEAEFAFRQAFALCPYNLEVLFRYVNLLTSQLRFDEALVLARTSLKLDPFNAQFSDLIKRLEDWKNGANPALRKVQELQKLVREQPGNLQAQFDLAGVCLQAGQTGTAVQVLDGILNHPRVGPAALRTLLQAYSSFGNSPKVRATVDKLQALARAEPTNFLAAIALAEGNLSLQNTNAAKLILDQVLDDPKADSPTLLQLAQQYADLGDYPKLESTLVKLTKLAPGSPEAWYDFAALEALLGKSAGSLQALAQAFDLSAARLRHDPKAPNLVTQAQSDPRFSVLRQTPEFKRLTNRPSPP
jgi:thioredoxin-like negative regulator of GroEL